MTEMSTIALVAKTANLIRENKGQPPYPDICEATQLRDQLGFDSLDLAELTVRLESETGVDVFVQGVVLTVGEVVQRISHD